MKENLIKVKKFVEKHDEIFVTILIFIMSLGYSLYVKTCVGDEVWNFQNVYKIYNGYKIYVDANVITTPIFHCIGALVFKIFGANFFVFRMYSLVIYTIFFVGIYKLFKCLKIDKKNAFFLLIIFFALQGNLIIASANYNTFAIMFLVFAVMVVINKENIKHYVLIESILITLIFLTKQNIGVFYLIGLILYTILNKKELKNTIKIIGITGIFGILFVLILYFNNILDGFISYAILGIKEFDTENKFVDYFAMYATFVVIINGLLLIYTNSNDKFKKRKERKNINNIACFAYPLLGMTYPIFNISHVKFALSIQYVLLFYILYLLVKGSKIEKNKIKKYIIFILEIFIIGYYSISSITYTIKYFRKISNDEYGYNYNNPYFGTSFDNEIEKNIKNVTEYMQNCDKEVVCISTNAGLYMIPLKQNNKEFDMLLLGNLGKDGENGVIEKLKEFKGKKIILMNKEKKSWQESDKIIEFVKNNFTKIGEIEDMLIYE